MALSVKFYQRPHYMEFLSDKEGRPVHEPRDYVRIEIPGMVANVVDTLAGEHHKRDHPMEWAQYVAEKATGDFSEHQGTLLSDWPQLSAVQVLEMRHLKFYTVEQVADASDLQIQSVGMLAGMAPQSLRDKAKAWLANAAGPGEAVKAELAKRDAEIAELNRKLEALMAMANGAPSEPKAKRPYKRKETAEA